MHPPVSSPPIAGETWYPHFWFPDSFWKKKKGKRRSNPRCTPIDRQNPFEDRPAHAHGERTCTTIGMPPCTIMFCCVVWPVSSSWCRAWTVVLLRRRASRDRLIPDPSIPRANVCVGPYVSTRSYSTIGGNRCYEAESVRPVLLHKRTSEAKLHILGIWRSSSRMGCALLQSALPRAPSARGRNG